MKSKLHISRRGLFRLGLAALLAILPQAVLFAGPLSSGHGNANERRPLSLASVFSDHMVLQRDRPLPIWGWAEAGGTVVVEFGGQMAEAVADQEGKWRVDLAPLPASVEPRSLVVRSGTQTRKFEDVLVGEVWLCSGQSNMEWRLKRTDNGSEVVARANHPQVRLFHTPRQISLTPLETVDASWKLCTPGNVPEFSALAYYFGRKLQQDLGVPVGLLLSAWGGTPVTAWTPPSGFKANETLRAIYKDTVFPDELDQENKAHRQYPGVLYNGMIHAHVPFAIRGVIWYQGEANVRDEDVSFYVEKTRALVDSGWRKLWGYEFPFYFVQLTPFRYWKTVSPEALPQFWEAQSKITETIPNTGMAVASDTVTKFREIHPTDKATPGERLALIAEARIYGRDVIHSGPTFASLSKKDHSLIARFDSSHGLSTRDGNPPDWFEIAGHDGEFKKAQTRIDGDTVILTSPEVIEPTSVRFSWNQTAVNNLVNSAGLPAPAFRASLEP